MIIKTTYIQNLQTLIIIEQDNQPIGSIKSVVDVREDTHGELTTGRIVIDRETVNKDLFSTPGNFNISVYKYVDNSLENIQKFNDCVLYSHTIPVEVDNYIILEESRILYV